MSKPITNIYNALTGITEVREMTEAEYTQHLEDIANATPLPTADSPNS